MLRLSAAILFALVSVASLGCASRAERATLKHGVSRVAVQKLAMLPPPEKEKRRHDATVYLDGNPLAIVKFRELPPKLRPVWKTLDDGRQVRRYRFTDYLESLGLDLAKLSEVHFYGGRGRVAIVRGDSLRKGREELLFSFTQGERGKFRMNFPGRDRVEMTGLQPDIVEDVAVYKNRPAPRYDIPMGRLVGDDGDPLVDIPFAPMERPGGTRIYVDGALVASIKRKTLPERVVVPGTTETGTTRFSLEKYLEMVGVDVAAVRGVEVLANDELVASLDAGASRDQLARFEFTMPKRSKGLIEIAAIRPDAKLEALMLYVQRNRDAADHPGSSVDHPRPETAGKAAVQTAARSMH